jgi:methyl-accepting chemotaxis protein
MNINRSIIRVFLLLIKIIHKQKQINRRLKKMGLQYDAVVAAMAEMETNLVEIEAEYNAVLELTQQQAQTIEEQTTVIAQLQEQITTFGTVEEFNAVIQPIKDHIVVLKDKQ